MFLDEKLVPDKFQAPMDKEQFNKITLSMTETQTKDNKMPVYVSLVIRTTETNRILVHKTIEDKDCVTNIIPVIDTKVNQGYFSLLEVMRNFLIEKFNPSMEAMLRTALIPVTIFKHENGAFVDITLVIPDSDEEHFTISGEYEFKDITEIPLNNLDWCSTIILPNEPIVKGIK